jgi:hypothetical protein
MDSDANSGAKNVPRGFARQLENGIAHDRNS